MAAPLCRYCGEPIRKVTCTVYVREGERKEKYEIDSALQRYVYPAERPRSMADCQKLTNDQVVSIRYGKKWIDDVETSTGNVSIFTTWDGKSYVDEFFCTGEHARLFGYAGAKGGFFTTGSYRKALKQQSTAATAANPGEDR